MKNGDIEKLSNRSKYKRIIINFILFPFIISLISNLIYYLNFENSLSLMFKGIGNNIIPFIFITFYISLFNLLFYFIFNNEKIANRIIYLFVIIFMLIDDIKLGIMGNPIEVSDVNYLNPENISEMGDSVSTIGIWILKPIIKFLVVLALFVIVTLKNKKNKPIKIKKTISRVLLIILVIILLILCFLGVKSEKFINFIYGSDTDQTHYSYVKDLYIDYGFFTGMYLDFSGDLIIKVPNYDDNRVIDVIDNIKEYTNGNNWGKANVVFLLSEAFTDINNFDLVTFDKELTPNINSFKENENMRVIDLLVPAYGGTSVNSEFEVLTGTSLTNWDTGYIPYTEYFTKENYERVPSLIREFNNNGYETIYLTPWGTKSYDSEKVYSYFGTKRKIYGDSLNGETKGGLYSDHALVNDIYNELKSTSEGNYKFIMSASMENHFPYSGDKFGDSYDINVTSTKLNENDTQLIKNYAQGCYDADKALGELYQLINTLSTPTIVVFFGDHFPYIVNDDGESIYLESSYFETTDSYEYEMKKHTTKAVIMANFDLEFNSDISYVNASYLGAYVINSMDLNVSEYFKFIDYERNILPVYNREAIYIDNRYIGLDLISSDQKKSLEDLRNVWYKYYYN